MSKITKIASFLVVTTVIGFASSAAMACLVCEPAPAPEPEVERQSDGGGVDSNSPAPSGVSIDLNAL